MNDTLLRLSDLRQLGLEGGVMLYLQDGTVAKCRPKFAAIQKKSEKWTTCKRGRDCTFCNYISSNINR